MEDYEKLRQIEELRMVQKECVKDNAQNLQKNAEAREQEPCGI